MRTRSFVSLVLLPAVLLAPPAGATVRNDPVQFRVVAPPQRDGSHIRITVEATPLVAGSLEIGEVSGEGFVVRSLERPERASVAAGASTTFTIDGTLAGNARPLLLAYQFDGQVRHAAFDLSALDEQGRERVRVMLQRPGTGDRDVSAGAPEATEPESRPRGPLPAGVQAVPGERDISLSGRVQWLRDVPEANDRTVMPAEGVTVKVYDEDGLIDTYLAQATTDRNGNWSISFHWRPLNPFDPDPDLYLQFNADNGQANVTNPLGLQVYRWYSGTLTNFGGTSFNWGDWWPGETDSPILGILTNLLRGRRWYQDKVGVTIPPIRAIYPEPLAEVVGSGTWYNGLEQTIHIAPLHKSKEDTHLHELGHHFVHHFASSAAPDYCNGVCDSPADLPVHGPWECGHCMWCSETNHDAWAEGFPNFIAFIQTNSFLAEYGVAALFQRNLESLDTCNVPGGTQVAWTTEGTFTAFLQDLWDAVRPEEPSSGGGYYSDELALGHDEIFAVAMQDGPTTTEEFVTRFRARYPQYDPGVFALLRINTFNPVDTTPCPAPTGLGSPSHTPGVSSTNREIIVTWTPPVDDFSGRLWSFMTLNTTARMPGTPGWGFEYSRAARDTLVAPGPGTYWVNIHYEDRQRNAPTAYASFGPIVIANPSPADLVPFQRVDWAYPLVPRPINDVSAAALAPTILKGDSTTYWNLAYQNSGMQTTASGFLVGFDMDGSPKASTLRSALGAGVSTFATNRATTIVPGRHVLEAVVDPGGAVAESNEDNNRWAHQWAWTPPVMSANSIGYRTPPTDPLGGWDMVGDGSTTGYNCDGLRFDASLGWWNAVWVAPNATGDYDVRLHHAAAGVDTGFIMARAGSYRPTGLLDAVFVNRNVMPGGSYDVSVLNMNGDNYPYACEHVTSAGFAFGDSLPITFAANARMILREVYVPATAVGLVSVTVKHAPGRGPLRLAWLDRTAGYAGLSGLLNTTVTDSASGRGHVGVSATAAGYHAVAIWRDPAAPADTLTFVLDVEGRLPDLAAAAPSLWAAPVVPRRTNDGTPGSVTRPDSLVGWAAATYLNVGYRNLSSAAAPGFYSLVRLDGVPSWSFGWAGMSANGDVRFNWNAPQTVRGGRHTLSTVVDNLSLVDELSEANNAFGEQYVWSPLALAPNATTTRSLVPPKPFAAFTELTVAEPFYANCDGYRTPTFAAAGADGWWGAVVLTPLPDGDADLRLHEVGRGAKTGFDVNRAWSAWGPSQTDYVLVNFNRTAFRAFDVGVVQGMTPGEAYALEPATSVYRGSTESTLGPFTLGSGRSLQLHEFSLTPGSYLAWLDNRTGNADLGITAHRPDSTYQTKSVGLGSAWQNGPAQDEQFTFQVPSAGFVCLAVWKAGSADHFESAEYTLQLRKLVADVDPDTRPHGTALSGAWPNPAASSMHIAFELARREETRLEVYDVSGARVRTLLEGTHAAGRHRAYWDGRDQAGRPVRGGVYFVRLLAGAYEGRLKVAKLD